MQPLTSTAQLFEPALAALAIDLRTWALAWARVAPTLAIVPAFGLNGLPAATRAGLGLALAVCVAPALEPVSLSVPFALALVLQAARGLPVALAAAAALWAAGMAGGLVDTLRGARDSQSLPVVDEDTSPLGALLSLLVALLFLQGGGAARVTQALAAPVTASRGVLVQVGFGLTNAVGLALAVAAPVVAVSIVVELVNALIARAATPAHIAALLAPLRSIVILAAFALLLERMTGLLAMTALASR